MSRRRATRRLGADFKIGTVVALAGVAWLAVVVLRAGDRALDRDPTPVIAPLVVVGIGCVFLTIARVRRIFRSRGGDLARDAGGKAIENILDDL